MATKNKKIDFARVAKMVFTYCKLNGEEPHRYGIENPQVRTSQDGNTIISGKLFRHREANRIGGIGHFRADCFLKVESVTYK